MSNAAKYVICPECEGEGSFGPGFVWTADEVEQYEPEEFADFQRELREGHYNVPCETCKGERAVVDVEDDGEVRTTAAERWADTRAYREEVAAEARYFGYV